MFLTFNNFKKYLCILFIPVFAFAGNLSFAKNTGDDFWYGESAAFCAERGYLEDNEFNADQPVERRMFARLLYSLDNRPTMSPDDPDAGNIYPFSDLTPDDRYKDEILWANENGILVGYDDGRYGVSDSLTRAQIAVGLLALANYKCYEISGEKSLERFPDSASVGAWAREAMSFCVGNGIIAGRVQKGRVTLSPSEPITGAELAVMTRRFRENIMQKEALEMMTNGKYLLGGGSGQYGIIETRRLYEAHRLSEKEKPNVLFIGYASGKSDISWLSIFFSQFEGSVANLSLSDAKEYTPAKEKIESADIFIIDGGDTVTLMNILRENNLIGLLRAAAKRGAVFAGASAGAIFQSECGVSWAGGSFKRIEGIGGADILFCPHSLDSDRFAQIRPMLEDTPGMKCVASDGGALEIADGRYRAFPEADSGYHFRLCEIVDGEYKESELSQEWHDISELIDY